MKKMENNITYFNQITYENIYKIWKIVRRTCKNKKDLYEFELFLNSNLYDIYDTLINIRYKPGKYKLFLIFEPKERLVMSQSIRDKIINHFVSYYYLIPILESKLIDSNVATRKNKGTKYANKLLNDYINKIRMNSDKDIYCLKLDISKYFYNINHDILIKCLEKYINDINIINIIKVILDETNNSYINEYIININKFFNYNIPLYRYDTGLSIGAMTSQFLAIFYLNEVDHYIKEELKCKYYIRYMDDFIILSNDLEYLNKCFNSIKNLLEEYKLIINKKSTIINLRYGLNFLGYKYKINNKYYIGFKKSTYKKMINNLNNKDNIISYINSYNSYNGYKKKVIRSDLIIMNIKEKYVNYKDKYKNYIVIIKDNKFYKTFYNDACIMYMLFGYRYKEDTIAYGEKASFKVIDTLNRLKISYVIINDNITEVKYKDRNYVNILDSALENIEEEERLNKLIELLKDKVSDIDKYDKIYKFLLEV